MISVVMPAYNAEPYIAEAIESILKQTFTDFEFIIVDDNSSDRTLEIIESYAQKDERIRVMHSTARNASGTRNVGIKVATGDYIAFMDADDVALPERLAEQCAAAKQHPEVVAWGTHLQRITPEGLEMTPVKGGCKTVEEFEALDLSQEVIRLYGNVMFVRRDALEKAGGYFDERFPPCEDAELSHRLAEYGPILTVQKILQLYRQHDNSISVRHLDRHDKLYGYIKAREAAKQENRDLSFDDYTTQYEQRSKLAKFNTRQEAISKNYGRRYKIALARKNYVRTAYYIFMMLATHPLRFVRRIL